MDAVEVSVLPDNTPKGVATPPVEPERSDPEPGEPHQSDTEQRDTEQRDPDQSDGRTAAVPSSPSMRSSSRNRPCAQSRPPWDTP
jgi:hypothetical protein